MEPFDSEKIIRRIREIKLNGVIEENELRARFLHKVKEDSRVLDCGQSLREFWPEAKNRAFKAVTLDINQFADYPDILADICDYDFLRKYENSFDLISCFSLIEHTYNPFWACGNLFSMCRPGGMIFGSAPFLFPRHSPEDLSYQDYFRFTRDSYALLFPNARSIELFPLRGRLATSLNVLTLKYRFILEKSSPKLSQLINRMLAKGNHALNSSGYGFIVTK